MNWGHKIFITFLIFGALIISLVVISMREDISLVAVDYYEQELDYQSQIDRKSNYRDLEEKPYFTFDKEKNKCVLTFPQQLVETSISGQVHFFRPSSSIHDKIYLLELQGDTSIEMDITGLIEGMWSLRVSWSNGDKSYYFEQSVFL